MSNVTIWQCLSEGEGHYCRECGCRVGFMHKQTCSFGRGRLAKRVEEAVKPFLEDKVQIKSAKIQKAEKDEFHAGFCPKHGEPWKNIIPHCPKCWDEQLEKYMTEPAKPPTRGAHLPVDAKARKSVPICTGVLDYFPKALAAVADLSRVGNEQHNPGQPLHWDKTKSTDHADCLVRHLLERNTFDTDGVRHATKVAWRALALLETLLEKDQSSS